MGGKRALLVRGWTPGLHPVGFLPSGSLEGVGYRAQAQARVWWAVATVQYVLWEFGGQGWSI